MSTCRGCGREIVWGVTSDGKRIPLDPRPPVYRTGTLLPEGGVRCERDREALCSHFATCPNADQFSGSRRKEG